MTNGTRRDRPRLDAIRRDAACRRPTRPDRVWRDVIGHDMTNTTRPDVTRPDMVGPDRTRPDVTRPTRPDVPRREATWQATTRPDETSH